MSRASSRIGRRRPLAPRALRALAALAALLGAAGSARAGTGWIFSRGAYPVQVQSMRELRWNGVVQQQRDFSCGAAAVATLLTHHLETPTPEYHVLLNMWLNGDQAKIQQAGFSMLDLTRYLQARGFQADGYRVPLERLQRDRIAAIALLHQPVRDTIYHHFVVIKGVSDEQVFFADSATGLRVLDRASFQNMLDPVLLVVRSHLEVGRRHFAADPAGWKVQLRASNRAALDLPDLASAALLLPRLNEF